MNNFERLIAGVPILIRHSQGDRWDLLVILPSGSFTDYYSRQRIVRRETAAKNSGLDGAAYLKQMYDLGDAESVDLVSL